MTTLGSDMEPSIGFQQRDEFPDLHRITVANITITSTSRSDAGDNRRCRGSMLLGNKRRNVCSLPRKIQQYRARQFGAAALEHMHRELSFVRRER